MSASARRQVRSLLLWLAAVLALAGGAAPAVAQPGAPLHILASLVPESDTPAAGARTWLAIAMVPQPGWHGYWQNPGDAGLALQAAWTLPKGVSAGAALYPVPTTLLVGGLMNHVYQRPYALMVPLTLAPGLARGTRLPIAARLDFLACTARLCVPQSATVATVLTVGNGAPDPASAARFDGWRRALPRPLGSPARFAVKDGALRIAVPLPAAVPLPDPHLFPQAEGAMVDAAPQRFSRDGDMLVIETRAGPSPGDRFAALLATGDGTGLTLTAVPGPVPAVGTPLGAGAPARATGWLALFAFLGAVAGGIVLNVMPCVFPILSLKALSLARLGGDERAARREALAYAAGVVLVCLALGAIVLGLRAGGSSIGWAFQLQDPRVILALLLLTAAIALNLAGLFELGGIGAGSGLAARGGAAGAFWTGALAAFVATPCTGPFMAGALGAALVLPWGAALAVFAGLGLGLALPFLALGFLPGLRRGLPKPGPWMGRLRRILAVPMALTAIGLAWVLWRQTGGAGLVAGGLAAILLALGLWATGRQQRGLKPLAWAPAACALLLASGSLAVLPRGAAPAPLAAGGQRFSEARLASLRAAGKPVFVYFTADWCLSCKVNEKAAIDRAETQAAFARAGVVTLVGDWTGGDPAIGRFLEAHGRSGVPLYLWYAPGRPPRVLPQILTPGLLAGLARA